VPSNAPKRKGAGLAVPHRLQPDQLHSYLEGLYTREFVDLGKFEGLLKQFVPTRPLPGELPGGKARKKARDLIDEQVLKAEEILYLGKQTCAECHHYEGANRHTPKNALKAGLPPKGLRVEPANVPAVWFEHARFDHAAHRALDCLECHKKASSSTVSSDVLIPGMDNCVKCHAPRSGSGAQARGGARFDCVECHRYHHGDEPLHGRGSSHRGLGGQKAMTVQDFLGGSR
jgi:hypothetical protein